jgi:hypothetical protein
MFTRFPPPDEPKEDSMAAKTQFDKDREKLRSLVFVSYLEESETGRGILSILRATLTGNPQDRSHDDQIPFIQPVEILRHVLMAWGFPGIEPEEIMKVMETIKTGFYSSIRGITSIKVVSEDEELIISNLGKWSISPDGELTVILEDGRTETERARKTSDDVIFGKNAKVYLEGGTSIQGYDSSINVDPADAAGDYGGSATGTDSPRSAWDRRKPADLSPTPSPLDMVHPGNIEEVMVEQGEVFIRIRTDHDLVPGGTTKLIGPVDLNDLPPWLSLEITQESASDLIDITAHGDETHRFLNPRTGETFGGTDP